MELNRRCTCGETSRGERITDGKCFQHGSDWSQDEIAAMSPRDRLLFQRYRAMFYIANHEMEINWWIGAILEEAARLEPDDPCIERLSRKLRTETEEV